LNKCFTGLEEDNSLRALLRKRRRGFSMEEDKGYLPFEIPGGKIGFAASYSEQPLADYMNNPLIEALPPILSKEEAIKSIAFYPHYIESERELSAELRLHCVGRLMRFVEPIEKHITIEEKISRCIRDGYISRNPFGKEHIMKLQIGKKAIVSKNEITDFQWEQRNTAQGFAIIGISGIGKTTAVERVLSLYPQVIVHSQYKGKSLSINQLPYLKLDCPSDGSLVALCINFFKTVDEILGTDYKRRFSSRRAIIPDMCSNMAQVATIHSIGVLVIDEVQHLSVAGDGYEKMLNFFVTLANTFGIPVVLIGTPKALGILQSAFRQARSGAGQGDVSWDKMEQDEEWDFIMETMWHYQWTKTKVELSDGLNKALYEESQGIVDIAVKLYILAQIEVIGKGKEIITPETFRKVAKRDLKFVQKYLKALRSGNLAEIGKYDDIQLTKIVEYFENKQRSFNNREAIRLYRKQERNRTRN
jgi:hypothetical protein